MATDRPLECTRIAVSRARARAEAAEWAHLLDRMGEAEAQAGSEGAGTFAGQATVNGAVMDLAAATGWSEFGVRRRANAAEALTTAGPTTWAAFSAGDIDATRALLIADAIADLQREASHLRLDLRAARYAATHSVSELRQWLKKFIARVEPDEQVDAAERARADRRVDVSHGEHGMALVTAYVPSLVAEAIRSRLDRAARALAPDHRTLEQKKADLFAAWLTQADETDDRTTLSTDIAVVITAEALAGARTGLVQSYDGQWHAPLSWLRDLVHPDAPQLWHRIVTTPTGDLLDHTYLGRFYPDLLSTALKYRDQTCQSPGCTVPARRCDLDHRIPHPRGPTTADNGQHLCRRHHQMKGHGQLVTLLDGNTYSVIRPSPIEERLRALLAA